MIHYSIAKQYTEIPGPRFKTEGVFSGEDFRETVLMNLVKKAKNENDKIELDLDGGYGYPTSFLEEAFGGLIRALKDKSVRDLFIFKSDEEPAIIEEINQYFSTEVNKLK